MDLVKQVFYSPIVFYVTNNKHESGRRGRRK